MKGSYNFIIALINKIQHGLILSGISTTNMIVLTCFSTNVWFVVVGWLSECHLKMWAGLLQAGDRSMA
jgi:hypothetical protein